MTPTGACFRSGWVVITLALALSGCSDDPAPADPAPADPAPADPAARPQPAQISAERKAAILQFWVHYRRATDLRVSGKTAAALAAYEQALAFDPEHEDALYYAGNMAMESGRFDLAQQSWRHLLEVNPKSARAHGQLGALYCAGIPGAPFDLDMAETEIQRAHALNRGESGPLLKLGEIALLKGDLALARERLSGALQTNFRSTGARYLSGYLDWVAGDLSSAREHLQAAIELGSGSSYSESVSSEGTTAKGSRPLLEGGLHYGGALPAQWARLSDWNDPVTGERTGAEYERLRTLIASELQPSD